MAPTTENIPVAHAVAVTAEDHAASTSYHKTPSATNSRYRQQDISASKLDVLKQQGYSLGMAKSLQQVKQVFPKRIFIIDNSWSMQQNDGHRMLETNKRGDIRMVSCTRWEEIQECMSYHIRLVGLIEAPTSFRVS